MSSTSSQYVNARIFFPSGMGSRDPRGTLLRIFSFVREFYPVEFALFIACIIRFTDTWAVKGAATLKQPVYRRLMRILDSEDNQEYFKLYRESPSYKANHHDTFKNTKDSAGYVFNG